MHKELLIKYLSQLVAMKTVSTDKDANRQALRWVREQLKDMPLHTQFYEFEGHPSLVLTTRQTKTPKVLLAAHIDVVAAAESLFTPKIEGHKMYGRGSYDMKMAIACYLLLLKELQSELAAYDFGIMLTSDEEIGGMYGIRPLLEAGYRAEVVFLPDGGFNWHFEEAAKGVLLLHVTAHGRAAHGSRPWEGENAIAKLISMLQKATNYFHDLRVQSPDYYATMNIGCISGGVAANQVPDRAEAHLDIRFPASLTAEEIERQLINISHNYVGIEICKLIENAPNQVNLSASPIQAFRHIAQQKYQIEIGKVASHGASDAQYFGLHHIPVIVIAPEGGDIHSNNEWVNLDDLARFYDVMKAWVQQMAVTESE